MPPLFTDIGSVFGAYPAINTAQLTGINSTVVAGFIDQAEAEVAAKVSARYALPFSPPCPLVNAIALRETVYAICIQRGLVHFPPAVQGKAPLAVQHESDQKLLQMISEGKVGLLSSSLQAIAPATTARGEVYSTTMDFNPTFHEGGRLDQVRDPEKIESIIDAREGRGL